MALRPTVTFNCRLMRCSALPSAPRLGASFGTRWNWPTDCRRLSSSLSSRAISTRRWKSRRDASAVAINDRAAFRADRTPYGGWRSSGLGAGAVAGSKRRPIRSWRDRAGGSRLRRGTVRASRARAFRLPVRSLPSRRRTRRCRSPSGCLPSLRASNLRAARPWRRRSCRSR